jgi:hypothetical protein
MSETTPKPPAKRSPSGRRPSGREQGRVVRRYLAALEASRSGRGAKRTIEGITSRVLKIDEMLVTADPLARLHLTQERIDLHSEIVRLSNGHQTELDELEKEFVRVAKSYGDQAGISFAAWRQVGVDAGVLEKAGIVRTTPPREPRAAKAPAAAGAAASGPADPAQGTLPEIPALPDPPAAAAEAVGDAAADAVPDLPEEAPAEPPAEAAPAEPAPKLRRKRISDEAATS